MPAVRANVFGYTAGMINSFVLNRNLDASDHGMASVGAPNLQGS
jgi:hypothetical protein